MKSIKKKSEKFGCWYWIEDGTVLGTPTLKSGAPANAFEPDQFFEVEVIDKEFKEEINRLFTWIGHIEKYRL